MRDRLRGTSVSSRAARHRPGPCTGVALPPLRDSSDKAVAAQPDLIPALTSDRGFASLGPGPDVGPGPLEFPPAAAEPGPAERRPRRYGDPRTAFRPPQPLPLLIGCDVQPRYPIAADSRPCPALPALR